MISNASASIPSWLMNTPRSPSFSLGLRRITGVRRSSSLERQEYGTWSRTDAEAFIHKLSYRVASKKNRVITGFGVGVGGAVINGALAYLNEVGKTISDEDLVMRPFPQVATGAGTLSDQWTNYRKAMLDYAGIAIFVFGNKRNPAGGIVPSNGMKEEFELCVQRGAHPLPIGATGFMARELWEEMNKDLTRFYPPHPRHSSPISQASATRPRPATS